MFYIILRGMNITNNNSIVDLESQGMELHHSVTVILQLILDEAVDRMGIWHGEYYLSKDMR